MTYDNSATALFHPEKQAPLLRQGYPTGTHALCAELSRLAYWRYEKDERDEQGKTIREKFEETLTGAGFGQLALFIDADTGTQGFAVTKGTDAYVVFRGSQTDEPADIFIDGCALPVSWRSGGYVHRGFLASYQAIEKKLDDWLAMHKSKSVYFTGHSLGAAIATLAAAVYTNSTLITFGSPRVGDKEFAKSFDGRMVFRYVNQTDLVTHVPPALLPFATSPLVASPLATSPFGFSLVSSKIVNYAHVKNLRYLDGSGNMLEGEAADTQFEQSEPSRLFALTNWPAQVRGMWSLTEVQIPASCLTDHAPVNYINTLIKLGK